MLPCDDNNRVVISALFKRYFQLVGMRYADARIDWQTEFYCGRFDRRKGPDVVIEFAAILLLIGRVRSKNEVRLAKLLGDDLRQGESAIETLAVKLSKPSFRLLPVPKQYYRLDPIIGPCSGAVTKNIKMLVLMKKAAETLSSGVSW